MDFMDRDLTCIECRKSFLFSADEQQFFKEKGFAHDPKRCKECKASDVSGEGLERLKPL